MGLHCTEPGEELRLLKKPWSRVSKKNLEISLNFALLCHTDCVIGKLRQVYSQTFVSSSMKWKE